MVQLTDCTNSGGGFVPPALKIEEEPRNQCLINISPMGQQILSDDLDLADDRLQSCSYQIQPIPGDTRNKKIVSKSAGKKKDRETSV